jgi:hypothetical protein
VEEVTCFGGVDSPKFIQARGSYVQEWTYIGGVATLAFDFPKLCSMTGRGSYVLEVMCCGEVVTIGIATHGVGFRKSYPVVFQGLSVQNVMYFWALRGSASVFQSRMQCYTEAHLFKI